MAKEVLMPALSPTMEEGNLSSWNKKEGDSIESGDVIAEIETDKATMEVESIDDGILYKIFVKEGSLNIKVNSLIAVIQEEGDSDEDMQAFIESLQKDAVSEKEITKETKESDNKQETVENNNKSNIQENEERIKISPLAKRIASIENVNYSSIEGSGPYGRIIKQDIVDSIGNTNNVENFAVNSIVRNEQESYSKPVSGMRKVIAQRLLESKTTIPHFYLEVECNLDELIAVRKKINSSATIINDKPEYKISINDMIVRASALAMKKNQEVNSSWGGDNIIYYNNVDIAIAVAIDGGLITPILRNADTKSLKEISNEIKFLVKKAKTNSLMPNEYQGGGFSISNLGMFGIKKFNAIVNPPQSSILAVGSGEDKLFLDSKGEVKKSKVMNLTISCDHRVIDGAVGASFLNSIKFYIENPLAMLV